MKINIIIDQRFKDIVHPILLTKEFQRLKTFIAHGSFSVFDHCLRVAILAYSIALMKKNVRIDSLVRSALLHDYYLYDWHHAHEGHKLHGFRHPYIASKNAKRDFHINEFEAKLIRSHMFPLTFWTLPLSKEARIIIKAEKKRLGQKLLKTQNRISFLDSIIYLSLP